jgi:hypothetical protein
LKQGEEDEGEKGIRGRVEDRKGKRGRDRENKVGETEGKRQKGRDRGNK